MAVRGPKCPLPHYTSSTSLIGWSKPCFHLVYATIQTTEAPRTRQRFFNLPVQSVWELQPPSPVLSCQEWTRGGLLEPSFIKVPRVVNSETVLRSSGFNEGLFELLLPFYHVKQVHPTSHMMWCYDGVLDHCRWRPSDRLWSELVIGS